MDCKECGPLWDPLLTNFFCAQFALEQEETDKKLEHLEQQVLVNEMFTTHQSTFLI